MLAPVLASIIDVITQVLAYGAALAAIFSVIDASSRRSDAFVAADKHTKGRWLAITIACAVVLGLSAAAIAFWVGVTAQLGWIFQVQTGLGWLAGVIGVLVYLVDVRPNLIRVVRGSRW